MRSIFLILLLNFERGVDIFLYKFYYLCYSIKLYYLEIVMGLKLRNLK